MLLCHLMTSPFERTTNVTTVIQIGSTLPEVSTFTDGLWANANLSMFKPDGVYQPWETHRDKDSQVKLNGPTVTNNSTAPMSRSSGLNASSFTVTLKSITVRQKEKMNTLQDGANGEASTLFKNHLWTFSSIVHRYFVYAN